MARSFEELVAQAAEVSVGGWDFSVDEYLPQLRALHERIER
ncbi:MAG TPA: hypothetical protein VGX23_09895 [Actinocrinis sp.]|nr:hypothetical protein [Actinocrinis sp.]